VRELRRGREAYLGDERILGSAASVEAVRREVAQAAPAPRRAAIALETILARVCASLGLAPAALVAGAGRPGSVGPERGSPTS
jgi:hypothetical protein